MQTATSIRNYIIKQRVNGVSAATVAKDLKKQGITTANGTPYSVNYIYYITSKAKKAVSLKRNYQVKRVKITAGKNDLALSILRNKTLCNRTVRTLLLKIL